MQGSDVATASVRGAINIIMFGGGEMRDPLNRMQPSK